MNTLLNTNYERKIKSRDRSIHKAMQILVDINQTTENFSVLVQPKNTFKLELSDHLWLPFLDLPHYNIVVFAIINFHVYNILVKQWKHVIGPNDIITFNEELESLSTSIIGLVNIDESQHETASVIFKTNKDFKKEENNYVTEDYDENSLELSYTEIYIYIMVLTDLWYHGG